MIPASGRLLLAALLGAGALYAQAGAWRNVEILAGVSEADMDVFMRAMNASLGVDCDYCHEAGGAWHLDGREAKAAARSMMRMIVGLSRSGFEALELPTCWTCHRGDVIPPARPEPNRAGAPPGTFSPGSVYENLRLLGDLSAAELGDVMTGYSASLGVDCAFCHVPGDWSSDEKIAKLLSRRMHEIQSALNEEFFGSSERVSCWTCHRGDAVPELAVPGI